MARTVTLSQLRTDIQNQADIVTGASGRYTPTHLTRLINQSIQRFRRRITLEGARHYLVSTSSTLGVGATSPYPFYELDLSGLSPALVLLHGIDITISNQVESLDHVPFEMRSEYGGPNVKGTPVAWAEYQTDKFAILPPPDQAYTYVAWYLPVLSDLSSDSDTFDGKAGWEDYVVWDVVLRLITRDNYASQYALAKQQCNEIWAEIVQDARRVTLSGGSRIGRDTLGRKMRHNVRRDPPRYSP